MLHTHSTRAAPPAARARLRRTLQRAAFVLTLVGSAAGCAGESTSPTPGPKPIPSAAGARYALRSYGGKPLPTVFSAGPIVQVEGIADTLTFAKDGTFVDAREFRETSLERPDLVRTYSQADTGTYAQAGEKLTLTVTRSGAVTVGRLEGSTLTFGLALLERVP